MINIKIPRQAIYRAFTDDPGSCPNCGETLVNEVQTYLVATRRNGKIADSFILDSNFGWFCTSCPIVVLNQDKIRRLLSTGISKWLNAGLEYLALGIVNLDAIPASKRHLPIGEAGNPIPLIKFKEMNADEIVSPSPASAVLRNIDQTESQTPTHRSKRRRKRIGSRNSAETLNQ
jgi:hypothetical protein